MSVRDKWSIIAYNLCHPILQAAANQQLKSTFIDKKPTAHLEAVCRVLLGIAPWIELAADEQSIHLGQLAVKAIASIVDPQSQEYIDFSTKKQVLVEAALLCQAFHRGYNTLWCPLPTSIKHLVIESIKKTRQFYPHDNNWELFPSMIEAFFLKVNEEVNLTRLWQGLHHHKRWYKGDGIYSDGEEVHMDYYNSFIIQPMLTDILSIITTSTFIPMPIHKNKEWIDFSIQHSKRLQRLATLQERIIAPDGTFPPLGRSLTYRCGAFHGLAVCAYHNNLPPNLPPSQVRVALTRVIHATLEHPDTFEDGWLTKGLYGKQPALAEPYINHGSLYMCSTVFLPLGLTSDAPFWTDADTPTTWERLVNGEDVERDKPYVECLRKHGKCV